MRPTTLPAGWIHRSRPTWRGFPGRSCVSLVRAWVWVGRIVQGQQGGLALQAAGIAGQAAVGAQHAVAGNDHAQGVAPHGSTDGAHRPGPAELLAERAIADGLATGDGQQRAPDALLKGGAAPQVPPQLQTSTPAPPPPPPRRYCCNWPLAACSKGWSGAWLQALAPCSRGSGSWRWPSNQRPAKPAGEAASRTGPSGGGRRVGMGVCTVWEWKCIGVPVGGWAGARRGP